jgi:purine-binding chemotaxis protein CheW
MTINDNNDFQEDYLEEDETQKDKYITFILNNEEYAIEIFYVVEIIGIQKITTIPDQPEFIKGIINLRGNIIPILDIRTRFNIDRLEYDERTCIIVVDIEGSQMGLIVDEVSEVLDISSENIAPPPQTSKKTKSRYIKGIGKVGQRVIIILDTEKILLEEELMEIVSVA